MVRVRFGDGESAARIAKPLVSRLHMDGHGIVNHAGNAALTQVFRQCVPSIRADDVHVIDRFYVLRFSRENYVEAVEQGLVEDDGVEAAFEVITDISEK